MRSKAGALTWLASGVGAIGSTLVDLGMESMLLILGLMIVIPLALLITTLALVAVYDRDPQRRAAAAKVLDRLLISLRADQRHGR